RKLFGPTCAPRSSSVPGAPRAARPRSRPVPAGGFQLGVSVAQAPAMAKSAPREDSPRAASPARAEARDNFASYWREVTRIPLLSATEQRELAIRYVATRSPALRDKLVTTNLRLVAKIAREFHARPHEFSDLVQEGNAGLMRAVERFDPSRGVKLSSYAAWWIRAYIMQYLMANTRVV